MLGSLVGYMSSSAIYKVSVYKVLRGYIIILHKICTRIRLGVKWNNFNFARNHKQYNHIASEK